MNTPAATGKSVPTHVLVLAAGLTLTFIAYCGTLAFQFVLDDHRLIIENPIIRSWRFLPGYFAQSLWASVDPDDPGVFYRPVFLLWLRTGRAVLGLVPWGWHLSNVLLHLLVTLLVYALASKIIADRITAALAAAIYGVHPVHVESVAWACGVIDPLMTALVISSFLCYLRVGGQGERGSLSFGAGRGRVWAGASLFLYGLALLAKEPAIMLPLLVFAYEWIFWPEIEGAPRDILSGKRMRGATWSVLPYLAVTAAYLVVREIVLNELKHPGGRLEWSTMIATWPLLLVFYLRLLIWPAGLSICYDIPYVTRMSSWKFVLPVLGLALVCGLIWAWTRSANRGHPRSTSAIVFACVWLILPILPALQISVFGEGDIAHDRYLYLPSVGFAILVALAMRSIRKTSLRIGLPAALVLVLVPLTIRQSLFWATDLTLCTRALSVAPNNPYNKTNLANLLVDRRMEGEAMALYQQVLARSPGFWYANYSLGCAYYKLGKLDQARWWLKRAISIYPYKWTEFLYLGLIDIQFGDLKEAKAALNQALRLQPNGLGIHFGLGMVLKLQGNLRDAAEEFKSELVVNPGEQGAIQQLAEIEGRGAGSSRSGPPPSN